MMSIERLPEDWERQRVFLAVLREGSLSGAARLLGLAQPTVRRRIEELEAASGAALFTRTPAGLQPTELARDLAGHAEAMAHAADAFLRHASAASGEVAGTVRISASEVIAVEVLPPLLAPLLDAHPALVIELSASNRTEDVLRREVDVAVRMVRPEQGALRAKHVGAIPLGLHAHRDYLARHGMPDRFEALRTHRVIGIDQQTSIVRNLRRAGVPIDRALFGYRSDSDLAQLAAIRAGIGIGVCQCALAARDPALVPVLSDSFGFALDTWVVCHEDLRGVARVAAVFEALVAGLERYLPAQPTAAASIAVAAPASA